MTSYLDKPMTPQETLAHAGTKGMKWGVRKKSSASSSSKSSAPMFSTKTKKTAFAVTAAGAAITATLLGQPHLGFSVLAVHRAANLKYFPKTPVQVKFSSSGKKSLIQPGTLRRAMLYTAAGASAATHLMGGDIGIGHTPLASIFSTHSIDRSSEVIQLGPNTMDRNTITDTLGNN